MLDDSTHLVQWAQMDVPLEELAMRLTKLNFQPGKFHIVTNPHNSFYATVVYVISERPTPHEIAIA